jgi:Sigma-70 region 2
VIRKILASDLLDLLALQPISVPRHLVANVVQVSSSGSRSSCRTDTRGTGVASLADRFHMQRSVRRPWRRYIDELAVYRQVLHAYCYRLTGNVWDGEDLVQDTLMRVFVLLGRTDTKLENPKAYLIRTATKIHRLEVTGDRIVRVRTYCFCPETLAVVAEAIGATALPRPHRSPSIGDFVAATLGRRPKWRVRSCS